MNLNTKKKTILITVIIIEIIVGFMLLNNYYQRKIVHKAQEPDKVTVISKENLVFPEESEFQYYYELQPSIEVIEEPEWLAYQAKYTYNTDGLNERFDYEIEKPVNTFRIITLGDSFTFGHFVSTKNNWTEQLEDLLNHNVTTCGIQKFEVINLGMAGWDIPYLVKRYKDIGSKYSPDLIIWFESGSGFSRLNEIFRPIIGNYVEECEKTQTSELEDKDKIYECHAKGWKKAQEEVKDKYSYEHISQIITKHLDKFFSGLKQEKVLFFTFNDADSCELSKGTIQQWREKYPQASFLSIVPSINVQKKTLSDGHPSVKGHETIASSIYEYLKNNVINQCEF